MESDMRRQRLQRVALPVRRAHALPALLALLLVACATAQAPPLPPEQRALVAIQDATRAYHIAINGAAKAYHDGLRDAAWWEKAENLGLKFLTARRAGLAALDAYTAPATPGDPSDMNKAVDAVWAALREVQRASDH